MSQALVASTVTPRARALLRASLIFVLLSATILERFGLGNGTASVSVALAEG